MKRLLFAVILVNAAFGLAACDRPHFTYFVNATGQPLTIVYASINGLSENNLANGSPWFWPFRTDPMLAPGETSMLTNYDPNPSWVIRVRSGNCSLRFDIPQAPDNAGERPDWRAFTAHEDAIVLLDHDNLLYRVPGPFSADSSFNVQSIPQPDGYPLAPTSHSNCS